MGMLRQKVILAILLGLRECLTTTHQEVPALPVFLTELIEMFMVIPVSSALFYLLLLPIAFLSEQIDPTGDINQTAVLGRGKCPRLPWTVCERSNSGKNGSAIPLIPGTDDPLLVTVLSELDICIMK